MDRDALAFRIAEFVRSASDEAWDASDEAWYTRRPDKIPAAGSAGTRLSFETLALDLFEYQYGSSESYRRLCDGLARTPRSISSWRQIPAVPTDAFRARRISCSSEAPAAVFRTSGTTGSRPAIKQASIKEAGIPTRGEHWMDAAALELYRLSLRTSFARLASRSAGLSIFSLIAPHSDAPDSSLSFMLSALACDTPGSAFFWNDGGPDLEAAARRLRALSGIGANGHPILLFATALGLLSLLEALDLDPRSAPIRLPAGSMVIETGGFKGHRILVSRADLYLRTSERLGVPASSIGSEYGMCEMASQFYDDHLAKGWAGESIGVAGSNEDPVKMGPPWVRTIVIDPDTGEEAIRGQAGILCHYDLCNLNSALCVRTQDVGAKAPTAPGFILRGRLAGAPSRGCSLTVEEWAERLKAEG